MTRAARREKKKFAEASSWSELKPSTSEGRVSKRKTNKSLKDRAINTVKAGDKDLVKFVKKGKSVGTKETKSKCERVNSQKRSTTSTNYYERRNETRREKRRLRRAKMKSVTKECFGCRESGHRLEDCPHKRKQQATGLCFKCGSTEHGVTQCRAKLPPGTYPYATCFTCGEKGHLTRSCPDNPKGLYPHGGGCTFCGSVEHLKANCPDKHASKQGKAPDHLVQFESSNTTSADADTIVHDAPQKHKIAKKGPKTVKF